MSFHILGTAKALPEFVLTNERLSTMVDTNDEWITSRTGIKNRFIITSETLADLAVEAAKSAIAKSGIDANQLDLIICATMGGDYIVPSLACVIQKRISAGCPAFDINVACTGFIYALDIASAYFDSGKASRILIVSAEMMSNYIDWTDRSTCVLFGDGAGSVVLEKGNNLLAIRLTACGDEETLTVRGVQGNSPFKQNNDVNTFLQMNGGEVFRFAVNSICKDITFVLSQAGISIEQIAKVIPHQANMRIIKSAKERLGIPEEKMVSSIERYGNTSAASIPIMLAELIENGQLHDGDLAVLAAFGGGLTTGACIIKI
ncbi:MAG: beta-ketoacyl-ACP synthase III [Oscillospiraceae bacterium]